MKQRYFPKGLTLLLELTAAVTVFAIAAVVCCLIHAAAERTSREAARLEEAVAALGPVGEICSQILAETPLSRLVKEAVRPKRKFRVWEIILLVLGLIGEYLGRIYMCINASPQFVERQVIKKVKSENAEN